MTVRHLLLDADDVLQVGPRRFRPDLGVAFGEDPADWLRETFHPDAGVLDGRTPVVPLLARRLSDLGRHDVDPQEVYDRLWLDIVPEPAMLEQVARWREAGLGVHLATNQDRDRAAFMQQRLEYAAVMDGGYYSCDLGVSKPSAAFFEAILDDLGVTADEVAFVDDMAANVEGARAVGLRAVQWELDDGLDVLISRLADVGLPGHPTA